MKEPARIVARDYLNVSDYPKSIAVLLALRASRDWGPIGLRSMLGGNLEVSWELLINSELSAQEKTVIRLVQAAFRAEGRGGLPQRVHAPLRALIDDLCGGEEEERS
jgi:hypothetical protein